MSVHIKTLASCVVDFNFCDPLFSVAASLQVVNEGTDSYENLTLELCSSFGFSERAVWQIDELMPDSTASLGSIEVKLVRDFFVTLAESTSGEFHFQLLRKGELLARHIQTVTLLQPAPRLTLIYDRSINYAFQQNAIPIVKELHFQNNGTARNDLLLRVTTEPAFAPTVEIRLQAIGAGREFRTSPVDLKLSHDFLAELNERVAGWLKVEMVESEAVVQSITEPISLLARNEWCGLTALPEILAAFVLPNDPAVMAILDRASEALGAATGRSALNGYQDKSRKRAWDQVAAIYKAICDLEIRYINPPASFENSGQKVRFPSEIVSQRFGTCLDLALLFAGCCEQAGLRPFVFIQEGHAYSGCWLEDRSLPEPAGDDLQQIRKLATDEWITVFETTALTNGSPSTLDNAELLAKPHLETEIPFR